MTYQSVWYHTEIPRHLVDTIEKDINDYHLDMQLQDAAIGHHEMINSYRNSKVSFIPPSHWIVGFCYNYILQANRDNFQYDIAGFEDNNMQYTVYNPGEYYHWHFDDDNVSDTIIKRKLSFSMQLSEEDSYTGGDLQFLSPQDKLYNAPKKRGTIIIFDSRTKHRVTRVKSGIRKSLVGWVGGPRWR